MLIGCEDTANGAGTKPIGKDKLLPFNNFASICNNHSPNHSLKHTRLFPAFGDKLGEIKFGHIAVGEEAVAGHFE